MGFHEPNSIVIAKPDLGSAQINSHYSLQINIACL